MLSNNYTEELLGMKIEEQVTLCSSCEIEPKCGCSSVGETENYNLDEVWNKYRIRMKVVVWECPDYEKSPIKG